VERKSNISKKIEVCFQKFNKMYLSFIMCCFKINYNLFYGIDVAKKSCKKLERIYLYFDFIQLNFYICTNQHCGSYVHIFSTQIYIMMENCKQNITSLNL